MLRRRVIVGRIGGIVVLLAALGACIPGVPWPPGGGSTTTSTTTTTATTVVTDSCDGDGGADGPDAPASVVDAVTFSLGQQVFSCNDDDTGNGDIDFFQVSSAAAFLQLDCGPVVANADDAATYRIEMLPLNPPVVAVTGEFRCVDGADTTFEEHTDGDPAYVYYIIVRHPPASEQTSFTLTDVTPPG